MFQVDVKNTFIHVDVMADQEEHGASSRRSVSVPASTRLAPMVKQPPTRAEKVITTPRLARSDSSTDVSTVDPSSEDDAASVDSDSLPKEDVKACSLTAKDPVRTRLKATAKAWRPQPVLQVMAAVPVMPRVVRTGQLAAEFLRRISAVAAAMVAAMNSDTGPAISCCLKKAYAAEGCHGWTVNLVAKSHDVHLHQRLLQAAKDILLQRATKAGALCVLGNAVQWTASGFIASLAELPDPACACWGFYAKGCCRKGISCAWQHPERSAPFQVGVITDSM
eukprot:TRINITY_DN588_c0_g1_i1.p1 TRINITY_DN588_c0_g1~~TRINITY_DN588_c0_g1_i1.p1  ORF type:complete len:279 (+),score=56.88 TRINITY_DN588_c0_g1_i1:112-948(+)